MIAALLRTLSLALTRQWTGARATWVGGPPALTKQRIYCVNHTSHLDSVLLLAALQNGHARPVAAAEYWNAGALRRYFARRVFDAVLLDRDRRHLNPLAPAFQALRQGDSLIFFPEGTRGPGRCLQPLKPGIFYLARAFPQVEIVPVWIDSAHRILPKRSWLPLPVPCGLTFGTPLHWDAEEDATAFLVRVRAAFEGARQHARPARFRRPALGRFSVNDV